MQFKLFCCVVMASITDLYRRIQAGWWHIMISPVGNALASTATRWPIHVFNWYASRVDASDTPSIRSMPDVGCAPMGQVQFGGAVGP